MPSLIRIDDPADVRIAGYRDIRERDLIGRTGRFVAVLCLAFPDGQTREFRGEIEGTIEAFAATPADAASRLAQGGFGSNGNKTMMPSFSGVSRTDSSGNSGSIRNYTVPDTSVSDSTRAHPIRPN